MRMNSLNNRLTHLLVISGVLHFTDDLHLIHDQHTVCQMQHLWHIAGDLLESISHPERLVIADELGHLSDAITQLNYAAIAFSPRLFVWCRYTLEWCKG